MDHNVYALMEVRNLGTANPTVDLYAVCPTYEDALDVYREKVGEPKTIEQGSGEFGSRIWNIDQDSTGTVTIARYTLHGPLEEA